MKDEEIDEYDRTKYFMDKNKEKIYAKKGGGHKGLAYEIIRKRNLSDLYYFYAERVPAPVFLTYCGYVLVDESEEKTILPKDIFDDPRTITYTVVGYCSIAIDEEYVDELKATYSGGDNILSDSYGENKSAEEKSRIEKIVERIRNFQNGIKRQKENSQDEEER